MELAVATGFGVLTNDSWHAVDEMMKVAMVAATTTPKRYSPLSSSFLVALLNIPITAGGAPNPLVGSAQDHQQVAHFRTSSWTSQLVCYVRFTCTPLYRSFSLSHFDKHLYHLYPLTFLNNIVLPHIHRKYNPHNTPLTSHRKFEEAMSGSLKDGNLSKKPCTSGPITGESLALSLALYNQCTTDDFPIIPQREKGISVTIHTPGRDDKSLREVIEKFAKTIKGWTPGLLSNLRKVDQASDLWTLEIPKDKFEFAKEFLRGTLAVPWGDEKVFILNNGRNLEPTPLCRQAHRGRHKSDSRGISTWWAPNANLDSKHQCKHTPATGGRGIHQQDRKDLDTESKVRWRFLRGTDKDALLTSPNICLCQIYFLKLICL